MISKSAGFTRAIVTGLPQMATLQTSPVAAALWAARFTPAFAARRASHPPSQRYGAAGSEAATEIAIHNLQSLSSASRSNCSFK